MPNEIVDASGLAYQLTPSGTCMEGEWDDIMRVVRQCHDHARGVSAHILTTITIEDEGSAQDKLPSNAASLEEKLGRKWRRVRATLWP